MIGKAQDIWRDYKNNGIISVIKRFVLYVPSHGIVWYTKLSKIPCGINCDSERTTKIIVSMTSYPERFNEIYLCIKSLLLQSYKPDRIIIWFGSDTNINDLSRPMMTLQQYGVEYRFDKENNLKSHKKYYYAMKEYPNDIVITVDDDVVYPRNTIKTLVRSYYRHPRAVSARRVHKLSFNNNTVNSYNKWIKEYRIPTGERNDLMAIGVGGVLYPPHCLNKNAFDVNAIIKTCLNADDVWLKCMEILERTKVVWVPCLFCHPPSLKHGNSLSDSNSVYNDTYLNRVMEKYKITAKDFL